MAPLPVNNTPRYMFDYVTGSVPTSREHTVTVRVAEGYGPAAGEGSPDEDIQEKFREVLWALSPSFFRVGWRVIRVRKAAIGSDFSFPIPMIEPLALFTGTSSAGYLPRFEAMQQIFVGRSASTGRKSYLGLYSGAADVDSQFRIEAGPAGVPLLIRNVVALLNGFQIDGAFISVSGTADTIWYQYLNQNYNSHWETALRF